MTQCINIQTWRTWFPNIASAQIWQHFGCIAGEKGEFAGHQAAQLARLDSPSE